MKVLTMDFVEGAPGWENWVWDIINARWGLQDMWAEEFVVTVLQGDDFFDGAVGFQHKDAP